MADETTGNAETVVETTVTEPTPEQVDVVAIDQEVAQTAPDPGTFWKLAEDAFANEADAPADYVKDLTADTLRELPGVSRQVLRDAVALMRQKEEAHAKALAEKDAWAKSEAEKLDKQRLDLARREAAFAALATDPKLKEALAVPEGDLPDAMTPEGIEARIKREAARLVAQRFEPVEKLSVQRDLERRYLEFVDSHPEMKDPGFKKEVDDYLTSVNKDGLRVRTPEAYEIVRGRRLAAADEQRRAAELAARQASAARMGRATASGAPSTDIPAHIRKNPAALVEFLEANPHIAKAIRAA